MIFLLYIMCLKIIRGQNVNNIDCNNLDCDEEDPVCGIRQEGEGFRLKLFENECQLIRYGCQVDDTLAYGIANMFYCDNTFKINNKLQQKTKDCIEFDCSFPSDSKEVCGIRQDGDGFRIRIFKNKCQLWKYNCENNINFSVIDLHICNSNATVDDNATVDVNAIEDVNATIDEHATSDEHATGDEHGTVDGNTTVGENATVNENSSVDEVTTETLITDTTTDNIATTEAPSIIKSRNIIIVDNMINFNNINESIDNFFAATHVFDLPVRDAEGDLNDTTRRMLVRNAGPIKVFKPWITKPQNVSEDYMHTPTLSSCFHKCPTKCPDTYAPVCGVPGIVAREPSLMFKNHCFMDVAQCKMFWEDKSSTSMSSNYIESSFLFCLGDELNGLYRFLPLVRTLQHMGRMKKKGHFRYKFKNMRFFNNFMPHDPRLMG